MISAKLHTEDTITEVSSATWLSVFEERGYTAFIFDCDGTLVESADVHFASFAQAASEQGHVLERDWYLERTGLDRISLFQAFAKSVDTFDVGSAASRSIALFSEISDKVVPIPETKALVEHLAKAHPLAVGTNAEEDVARASLRAAELLHHFDHIVAVTDGLKPKPSPEIFARAAALLGTPTARTLVIEDSVQGVQAAKAAGLDAIQISRGS